VLPIKKENKNDSNFPLLGVKIQLKIDEAIVAKIIRKFLEEGDMFSK